MPAKLTAPPTDTAARLRLAVMRLARRLRQQAPPGASPSQLSVLATLDNHGRMSLGELAAAERVQPPSMTRVVAALENAGLVERVVDPTDRRVIWISLTDKGRSFVDQARRRKTEYLARRLAQLDAADRRVLERAVDVIERLLDEER